MGKVYLTNHHSSQLGLIPRSRWFSDPLNNKVTKRKGSGLRPTYELVEQSRHWAPPKKTPRLSYRSAGPPVGPTRIGCRSTGGTSWCCSHHHIAGPISLRFCTTASASPPHRCIDATGSSTRPAAQQAAGAYRRPRIPGYRPNMAEAPS